MKRASSWSGWVGRGFLVGLVLWIATDFLIPRQHSIRQFSVEAIAQKDTEMWRSYYRREQVALFGKLAEALRDQFGAPFWQSWGLAFWAAKAAFDFKNGKSRADYDRVIPTLETYFSSIQALSVEPFDVKKAARAELDWWIVHREREKQPTGALAQSLAKAAGVLYNQPAPHFLAYGRYRAEAMRIRDEAANRPGGTTEADWNQIHHQLYRSWTALYQAVHP